MGGILRSSVGIEVRSVDELRVTVTPDSTTRV